MNKLIAYHLSLFFLISLLIPQAKSTPLEVVGKMPEPLSIAFPLPHPDPPASEDEAVKIDWGILQDIKYDLKYIEELEMSVYTPLFSDAIKKLDGKEVIIEGYIIPLMEEGNEVALSANPYASCFFCGAAGPASVMSVYLQEEGEKFKLDDIKKFRGKLKLNYDDPEQFYYMLEDAVVE